MNKKIILLVSFIFFALVFAYLFYSCFYISSLNAKITFETKDIISKINGQLEKLLVQNNSDVKKGEILAQIKQDELQKEYDKTFLELQQLQEKLNENDVKGKFITSQTKNNIEDAKIKLENANNDYVIYKNAYKDGTVTKKDLDKATKNLQLAKENFEQVQKNIELANKALKVNSSEISIQNEEIKKLTEKFEQAELNLSHTTFIAPFDAVVKSVDVELGKYINENQKVMTLVSKDFKIVAKFPEFQLKKINIDQEVYIIINPYKQIKGKILDISLDKKEVLIEPIEKEIISKIKNNKNVLIKIKVK